MDEKLLEQIRALATENGLDPAELERLFAGRAMPEELMAAMSTALGDVGLFAEALSKLDENTREE